MNLGRVSADLVQMQRWKLAIASDGNIPFSGQLSAGCRFDLVQGLFRRRLIKSDSHAVVLRVQPDLLHCGMIRDQPGDVRQGLMVCLCSGPIRVHGELFPAIVHPVSARFVIRSAFLAIMPQKPVQEPINAAAQVRGRRSITSRSAQSCCLPARLGVAQTAGENQHIQRHHRHHAKYDQVFHAFTSFDCQMKLRAPLSAAPCVRCSLGMGVPTDRSCSRRLLQARAG